MWIRHHCTVQPHKAPHAPQMRITREMEHKVPGPRSHVHIQVPRLDLGGRKMKVEQSNGSPTDMWLAAPPPSHQATRERGPWGNAPPPSGLVPPMEANNHSENGNDHVWDLKQLWGSWQLFINVCARLMESGWARWARWHAAAAARWSVFVLTAAEFFLA